MKFKAKIKFFLCLFYGFLGAHKFYEKNYKLGLLYMFTLGLLGIGWIIDTIKLFKPAFTHSVEKVEDTNKKWYHDSTLRVAILVISVLGLFWLTSSKRYQYFHYDPKSKMGHYKR